MLTTLRLILVWGIILTIAFLYFKPIIMCFLLMHKNNAGLATSKELREIEDLLRRHPWREEQELQLKEGETEAPCLWLKGFYTVIFVHVKNGVLICSSGPITSFRKSCWELYEANQLQQYISFLSANEDGNEASKLREQTHLMLANKKGQEKAQKWRGKVAICVELLALAGVLIYAKGKIEAPSSIVKNMVFSDFHYTETISDAFKNFDPNGEWVDISEKNALKDTGRAYAAWKGTCKSSGLFTETENWDLVVYFEVEQVDEGYYVSVDQVEFGNYRLNSSSLLQKSSIWEIMNMIYGNQNSVSVSADTGLFNVTYFLSRKDPAMETTTGQALTVKETSTPALVSNSAGTYSAVAQGFGGDVTVTVTVSGDTITDVTISGPNETPGLGSRAVEEMPARIIAAQSADVDGTSAATITSDAIKKAFNAALAQAGVARAEDRSKWEYKDYVEHYGFDPADYGCYWYNEIRNGPLDDFFESMAELVGEMMSSSRLYENTWISDLTWDDFIGTWQTKGGITFTIDRIKEDGVIEDYTIDLSGNGLGILGGWFSKEVYNIEGNFCGMAGNNGVTSFSVTYQYGTTPETNTWLLLEFVDSKGNEVWDSVPLVQDGVPCVQLA